MRKTLLLLLLSIFHSQFSSQACSLSESFGTLESQSGEGVSSAQEVTSLVDPRIGSEGLGRVFIGPCLPFGMAKPGPDCGTANNAGWAPMPAMVSGFSQTHVSGTGGGPKYGNVLIQPYSSSPRPQHRLSEDIRLGYYRCTYQESGITTEITAARHTSLYRFTFPKDSALHIHIDLQHFLGRSPIPHAREAQQFEAAHLDSTLHITTISQQDGTLRQDSSYTYAGYQTISGGWNNGKPYTVYFYAIQHPANDSTLLYKVAISFISEEQAKVNCEADLPDWDFDATYHRCVEEWQTLLSRLPIQSTATDQVKRMYNTALYHMCLMPTEREDDTYDDYYAIWDTYRTSTPLLTLLCPERATAIARSLLTIYQKDGYLPDARSGNSNGRTQGGSNAEIVLCDALARGLDIDAHLALEAMLKDATVPPDDDEAEGRGGLEEYNRLGYIPYIKYSCPSSSTSPSSSSSSTSPSSSTSFSRIPRAGNRTLEYAFDDWAIAQVAKFCYEHPTKSVPTSSDPTIVTAPPYRGAGEGLLLLYHQFMRQSERWKNLWRSDYEHDGCKGFIMPRDDKGNWLDSLPYGHSQLQPLKFRYTPDVSYEGPWYCKWWDCFMYEASSWEYSFSVPHDIPGLIELCGGKDKFEARLDTFFAHGYYNVANEPSFLTPLLYHWIGKPDKSRALIKKIIEENFSDRPDGLPGNDDGGAMSSWLACHLLGMYPLAGTNEWIKYEPIGSLNSPLPRLPEGRSLQSSQDKKQSLITQDGMKATFYLHGQKRKFDIAFSFPKDSLRLDWSIVRNLKTWHGSYTMTAKARKRATRLSYEQPLDGQHLTLSDDETFLVLSQQAFKQLKKKGKCIYSNTEWKTSPLGSAAYQGQKSALGGDKRDADKALLCAQSSEGATMWVLDDPKLPLIVKMENNPVEIDWEFQQ